MTTKNSEFRNKYGTIGLIVGSIAILFLSIGSLIYANISGNWTEPSTMEKSSDGDKTLTIENWNAVLNDLKYLKENGGSSSSTSGQIEIYGDENTTMIAVCNKWLTDNVPSGKGDWIWVPARYVPTAYLDTLNQQAYRKSVVGADGKNYICKGFAVMKYEASYKDAVEPNSTGWANDGTDGSNAGGSDATWNTIKWAGVSANGGIGSYTDRYPLVQMTQGTAISTCNGMGAGTHLLTDAEYMTIARNIEQQATNWSGNAVGNGYISNGVSNDATNGCGGTNTKTQYSSLTRARATKTGSGSGNSACDTKRQLTLSNGAKIWDLAGNVWEHVNKSNVIAGTNYNNGQSTIAGCTTTNNWATNTNGCWTVSSSVGTYGPTIDGGTSKGLGNVYYSAGVASNIFLRGGSAHYGASAGLFALSLNDTASCVDPGIGFRCSL